MIYKLILIFGLVFTFTGCFYIESYTEIKIINTTQLEYEEIRDNVRKILTNLNPPYYCDKDNETWGANREDGELICDAGYLQARRDKNITYILFDGGTSFWFPTNEIITDEHKEIQKLFIQMAKKYKKKYQNSTVKVIFYHNDIPKEGRILFQ